MADYIALVISIVGVIGTILYNRRKAKTDASKVALNGFGTLTKTLQDELVRLRARVTELETKQGEWEAERAALLTRIDALEAENEELRAQMEEIKGGGK